MSIFDILLLNDAIGMVILVLFTLLGVSLAKTASMKIIISIYAVLQFIMFLADFMYIAHL